MLLLIPTPVLSSPNPAPEPAKSKPLDDPATKAQPKKSNPVDSSASKTKAETQTGPTKAQNGTFTGHFRGSDFEGTIRFVVRAGLMVDAQVEIPSENIAFRIHPSGDLDSANPGFIGGKDVDFLRFSGRFNNSEQAAGTVSGNLARKKMKGQWYAIRR